MWRKLYLWLFGPSVPCACGGAVVVFDHGWTIEPHFACLDCGREMTEAEFRRRAAGRRGR